MTVQWRCRTSEASSVRLDISNFQPGVFSVRPGASFVHSGASTPLVRLWPLLISRGRPHSSLRSLLSMLWVFCSAWGLHATGQPAGVLPSSLLLSIMEPLLFCTHPPLHWLVWSVLCPAKGFSSVHSGASFIQSTTQIETCSDWPGVSSIHPGVCIVQPRAGDFSIHIWASISQARIGRLLSSLGFHSNSLEYFQSILQPCLFSLEPPLYWPNLGSI